MVQREGLVPVATTAGVEWPGSVGKPGDESQSPRVTRGQVDRLRIPVVRQLPPRDRDPVV